MYFKFYINIFATKIDDPHRKIILNDTGFANIFLYNINIFH